MTIAKAPRPAGYAALFPVNHPQMRPGNQDFSGQRAGLSRERLLQEQAVMAWLEELDGLQKNWRAAFREFGGPLDAEIAPDKMAKLELVDGDIHDLANQ